MLLSVIHDSAGNVLGLAASPPDAPVLYPETKAGQFLTIVDASEDMKDLKPEEMHAHITDVIANFRIDTEGARGRLARK